MEQAVQNIKGSSLTEDLKSWNQQESQFRNLFSEQALIDKEFLKMKLKEFNRIWYKYSGIPQSPVEGALMMMLNYQRRKLQQSLYPGLLTRLLVRAFTFSKAYISQRLAQPPKPTVPLYYAPPIPVPDIPKPQQHEQATQQQSQVDQQKRAYQNRQPRQWHQKLVGKQKRGKSKGRSI